jgi:hypothetical protein
LPEYKAPINEGSIRKQSHPEIYRPIIEKIINYNPVKGDKFDRKIENIS